ncbi:flagellar biosynthesis protein FlgJ [Candidatus Puniceispirillum sp.]|nr:flagellar biosynthesis protein FlgJ [Candidatus Puniceispirillum sp.]
MSSIDNNNSLNSILDKLGINQPKETKKSDTLGQQDFLKLMTTQLQNQDPFKPTDNTEMIAQMAQFSMVTGQTEGNETLKGISGQLSEFQIATAANMLGHSVLVSGNKAYPDADGTVAGAIDIPSTSTNTSILYKSANGEILHAEDLGPQQAGLLGFRWEKVPQNVLDENEYLTVEAYADTGTGLQSVGSSVFGEVLSASAGNTADGVVYDVRGYGDVSANDVRRFKK